MKLWVFSDLHLEYADLRQPLKIPEADDCVVAGDLCRAPANGVHWLAEISPMRCRAFTSPGTMSSMAVASTKDSRTSANRHGGFGCVL